MNWLGSFYSALRFLFARRDVSDPDAFLRVSNLTRQTVLATCMKVADSGREKRKGLLGRAQLNPGEGLWILPCEAVHTFGMQFSIDLIYLDSKRRIKKLRSDVPPMRFSACLSAHSVLELVAGAIRESRTELGDRLEFSAKPSMNEPRLSHL